MLTPGQIFLLSRYWFLRRRHRQHRVADVAVFHHGRCGSTVVATMLANDPRFVWDGEIFERMSAGILEDVAVSRKARTIMQMRLAKAWRSRVYMFAVKPYPEEQLRKQLANCSIRQFARMLRKLGFTHFVVLRRRNLLDRAISIERGRRTRVWHSTDAVPSEDRIVLDPEAVSFGNRHIPLIDSFRRLEAYHREAVECLQRWPCLELTYEDDIEVDPRVASRKIAGFIGMPDIDISAPPYVRTNPGRPCDKLENIEAIRAALRSSEYEWMLD